MVDAVEHARGFAPPLFVDVRVRRSVRALGFRDRAFTAAAHARNIEPGPSPRRPPRVAAPVTLQFDRFVETKTLLPLHLA